MVYSVKFVSLSIHIFQARNEERSFVSFIPFVPKWKVTTRCTCSTFTNFFPIFYHFISIYDIHFHWLNKTCVCETQMPPAATKSNMAKIPKSYILTEECEQPLDELTAQVWWLYHHPNLKYCTLFESGTELRTDRRTNKQTIQLLDAPGRRFRPGA